MKPLFLFAIGSLFTMGLAAQKLKDNDIPSVVRSSFAKKFPEAKSVKWSKENAAEFEAEFKNGSLEQSANFDQSGNWVGTETEIKISALPANVVKAINSDFPGYKVEEAEKVEKPASPQFFEVKVEKGKKAYIVQVSAEGKILKKEEEKEGKEKD